MIFYFIHVYIAPEQEGQPLGTIFDGSRKVLSLPSESMHIFNDFIHVHSPWAGTDNPLRPKC